MVAEKIVDGKPTGWRVVVPDHIKTDAQAHKFMQDLLPNEEGTWRIARDRDYYMSHAINIVESTAKRYGFDSAISARSYASVENKYQAFSIAYIKWTAAFWAKAENLIADMSTLPLTDEEIMEELPKFSDYASSEVLESVEPAVKVYMPSVTDDPLVDSSTVIGSNEIGETNA